MPPPPLPPLAVAATVAASARGRDSSGCQQERRAHPHTEEAQQRGAEDFEEGLHLQSKQSKAKQVTESGYETTEFGSDMTTS